MQSVLFKGDSTMSRFGHTITPLNKSKALLFGGAVGDGGKYVITSDTFLCDYSQMQWQKLENRGTPPSNRAAHASIVIDHFFFVFGGACGSGDLADDLLYQIDLRTLSNQAVWSVKKCEGVSPGRRYGHVLAFLKPYLIIFGGNIGTEVVGDIWKIEIFGNGLWEKIETGEESPPPRVYHSASICKTGTAAGMMVIFGGRGGGVDSPPLQDTWGLRKHRDGRLDWMKAPYKQNFKPAERYQHRSLFLGTLLLIVGGRNNEVGKAMPLDIYDTDTSDWYRLPSIQRFRHCCFMIDDMLFIHGGFSQDSPNVPTDKTLKIDLNKIFQHQAALLKGLAFESGQDIFTTSSRNSGGHTAQNRLHNRQEGYHSSQTRLVVSQQQTRKAEKMDIEPSIRRSVHYHRKIRLYHEAVVANFNKQPDVMKVNINMLPNQHKRLIENPSFSSSKEEVDKIDNVTNFILNNLFCRPSTQITHNIPPDYMYFLLAKIQKILSEESTLLRVRLPIKIFGDIHGQIGELNRFFDSFGCPSDESANGDIDSTNYLFLGDYVDRGTRSVETILLLFALKLKYPENVYLLRGAHEDIAVNRSMGFGDECAAKFRENIEDQSSFFMQCNSIFDKMPLAALIENSILCMHGGIGYNIEHVKDIERISRPLSVCHDPKTKQERIIRDLLWSDPCRLNETETTINLDHDYFRNKSNLKVSFQHISAFCTDNQLSAIIRSGQPLMEGFECRDELISVFSCSDYGGAGNKAAMIHVLKNEDIQPKIILAMGGKDRWLPREEGDTLRRLNFTPPKK